MLDITQAEMEAILKRGRFRTRVISLPVRTAPMRAAKHPRTGRVLVDPSPRSGVATLRCPVQAGGRATLRARYVAADAAEYASRRLQADDMPRARAVAWLADPDLYEAHCKLQRVTVDAVAHDAEQERWIITFTLDSKGEHHEFLHGDDPVFLSRAGGYTTVRDELDAGEVAFPLLADLEKARRKSREGRAAPLRESVEDLSMRAGALKAAMNTMRQENRLRRIQNDLAKLRDEVVQVAAAEPGTLQAVAASCR